MNHSGTQHFTPGLGWVQTPSIGLRPEEGAGKRCSECGLGPRSRKAKRLFHFFRVDACGTRQCLSRFRMRAQHILRSFRTLKIPCPQRSNGLWCGSTGGMEVGEEGDYIPIASLHCHHQKDSCIKMGSDESHFYVLVGSDGQSHKTVQCPQTTTFLKEKGEPKRYRTEVLPLTSLTPYR